jgi:hypothetical protein
MSAEDRKFVFGKLGGMDERWQTAPTAARSIRDMTWDTRGGWKTAGGYKLLFNVIEEEDSTVWHGVIDSLHWYSEHGGSRQHLIVEQNDRWYEVEGSNAKTVKLLTGKGGVAQDAHDMPTTPHIRSQSLAWGGYLYLVTGYSEPLVFNGRYLEQAGFDVAPPAPGATLLENAIYTSNVTGLGPDAAQDWSFRYRLSFVNERGQESPLSDPSGSVTGTNSTSPTVKKGVGLSIATGGDHVVARRIYRTHNLLDSSGELLLEGEAQNFYFLAEIQDNHQTTFEDAIPDAYIAALVDPEDFGAWPSGAKFIGLYQNTVFLAGHHNTELRFSAVGTSEVFPELNRIMVGDGSSGEFTGMYPTKGAMVLFKKNAIFLIKGNAISGFEVSTLTKTTGCIAPDSIAEIPNLGLAFLGNEGPMLLEGALENTGTPTRVIPIATPVPDMVERINFGSALQAQGEIYHPDREYWLAVPWDASERNNVVMVFHYEIGAWSFRENFPIGAMVVTADHRRLLMFGSNDASNEGVYAYAHGISDKSGTAIQPLYETTDMDFGDRYTAVVPETVTLWAIGYGDQDARIQYTVNRHFTNVWALGLSSDGENQQDPTNDYKTLNSLDWGAGYWYNLRPVPITFNVETKGDPACREFRVAVSSDGRNMQLVGLEILASVTPSDVKTEPLHLDLVVDRK